MPRVSETDGSMPITNMRSSIHQVPASLPAVSGKPRPSPVGGPGREPGRATVPSEASAPSAQWRETTEETAAQRVGRFRGCAYEHGLRLARVYLLSPNRQMGLQGSLVMDCGSCGERWLVRVHHAELISQPMESIEQIRQGRDGQLTVPPGAPGAP
jgi:hypothetical protein